MWRYWNLHTLLEGLQNGAAAVKKSGGSSKTPNVELSYDPAIPLLGMYLKELKKGAQTETQRSVHSSTTINERWKQPKCPSEHEWKSQVCHTHTAEEHLAIKRKGILTQATWMDSC